MATELAARPQVKGSITHFDIFANGIRIGKLTKTGKTHRRQKLDANAPLDGKQTYGMRWHWTLEYRNHLFWNITVKRSDALERMRRWIDAVDHRKDNLMPGNVIHARPYKDPASWQADRTPRLGEIQRSMPPEADLIRLYVPDSHREYVNHTIIVDRNARINGYGLNEVTTNLYTAFMVHGPVFILEELDSLEIRALPLAKQA